MYLLDHLWTYTWPPTPASLARPRRYVFPISSPRSRKARRARRQLRLGRCLDERITGRRDPRDVSRTVPPSDQTPPFPSAERRTHHAELSSCRTYGDAHAAPQAGGLARTTKRTLMDDPEPSIMERRGKMGTLDGRGGIRPLWRQGGRPVSDTFLRCLLSRSCISIKVKIVPSIIPMLYLVLRARKGEGGRQ